MTFVYFRIGFSNKEKNVEGNVGSEEKEAESAGRGCV